MKKISVLPSIFFSILSLKAFIQPLNSSVDSIMNEISESELSYEEIEYLENLAVSNPDLFLKLIQQDC